MKNIFELLTDIIENPYALKLHKNLKEYYQSKNMLNEAEAIECLIKARFNDNRSHADSEQSKQYS